VCVYAPFSNRTKKESTMTRDRALRDARLASCFYKGDPAKIRGVFSAHPPVTKMRNLNVSTKMRGNIFVLTFFLHAHFMRGILLHTQVTDSVISRIECYTFIFAQMYHVCIILYRVLEVFS